MRLWSSKLLLDIADKTEANDYNADERMVKAELHRIFVHAKKMIQLRVEDPMDRASWEMYFINEVMDHITCKKHLDDHLDKFKQLYQNHGSMFGRHPSMLKQLICDFLQDDFLNEFHKNIGVNKKK